MRAFFGLAFAAALASATVDPSTLTVSGISAGAAFAVQYQIAHSSKVRAAGIVAGIPFYCAQGLSVMGAFSCMDSPLTINIAELNAEINMSASIGLVDPVANIEKHAVMLFSGIYDSVVNHGTMELLAVQYLELGVHNIRTYFNYSAEHAWITNYWGNSCGTLGLPYINNCGLDFAGEFLRMAWKHMGESFNEHRGTFNTTNLRAFSQTTFGADGLTNSLAATGYYYVPSKCGANSSKRCHVHLNFHGCTQDVGSVGTDYVKYTGLNEWAEANDIIVVYPQAVPNALLDNPNACFDWWGYAGPGYANKDGVQMQIFESMMNYLTQNGNLPAAA